MTETTPQDFDAREILESVPEGFFALDREWRFTYLNRVGHLILGDESHHLMGRTIWAAYPGVSGTEFERAYRAAMQGETCTLTAYYERHRRWYEVHAYPSPDGIVVYFRDVSEQLAAEEARKRIEAEWDRERRIFDATLSNIPDLVYTFDLQHRFIYANKALLKMWGMTAEQSMGKTTRELGYPEWEVERHDREIEQVVVTKRPIRGEVPFTGTEGERVWDYIFAPVIDANGDVVAVAGTARDATDQHELEAAREAHAKRLQDADRAKDEFIATLSHELRNPLAPLRNSLALLKMNGAIDEKSRRIHQMMERQVDHLVRLVGDLLEISRVSRGDFALQVERVQMSSVVRNALETSEPVVQARKHRQHVSLPQEPVWVDGDPVRLAQVIANLVDNAAKYTPEGGRIDITLAREGAHATVRVRDNGPGISQDALKRIFDMFNRGERGGQHEGGLGIGLALARRLAEMHRGTLDVFSEGAGKGSEFVLRMPAAPAPEKQAPAQHAPSKAIATKRILVVDDNHDAADSLGMLLRELGAEVRIAHDGPSALAAYPEFEPAAVLLDIGMPRMDGYEVARELRRRYPEHATPLIAVTGWGQEQDRVRAQEAGFDHHMVKPAEIDVLRALLDSIGTETLPGG